MTPPSTMTVRTFMFAALIHRQEKVDVAAGTRLASTRATTASIASTVGARRSERQPMP
jgi:hypothetical protein